MDYFRPCYVRRRSLCCLDQSASTCRNNTPSRGSLPWSLNRKIPPLHRLHVSVWIINHPRVWHTTLLLHGCYNSGSTNWDGRNRRNWSTDPVDECGCIAVTGAALEGIVRLSSPISSTYWTTFTCVEFLDFARISIYFRLSLATFPGRIILVLATRKYHCRQGRLDRSSY